MKDLNKMSLRELREHDRRVKEVLAAKLSEEADEYHNEQSELIAQVEEYAGHHGWHPAEVTGLGGVDRMELGYPGEARLLIQFWPYEEDRADNPYRQAVTVSEVDKQVAATFNEHPAPEVLIGLVDAWWRKVRGL